MRLLSLAVSALFLAGCASLFADEVPRKIHGRVYDGPFVSEEAYSAYLIASIAEQQRNWPLAEKVYLQVTKLDPQNPDPWVRLGAVRCTHGAYLEAAQAFTQAAQDEKDFAPLLREQARCAFAQGDTTQARAFALQAVALDPSDPVPPRLIAQIAADAGDLKEARRWLLSLSLRDSRLSQSQESPLNPSSPIGTEIPSSLTQAPPTQISLAQLDKALSQATQEEARTLARRAGLTPGELATRAAALGLVVLAREQGRLILAADPGNTDAWIALLEISPPQTTPEPLGTALLPTPFTPPSAVGILLLARLLLRKSGIEPAQAVLRHLPPLGEDDLARRLRSLLETRIHSTSP